jgi:homoaconitate hydratase
MTHDNTAAVIPKFQSMGAKRVSDPGQPVFALDHDIQNTSPENLAKYAKIEAFARREGVAFHPAGRGIGHQVMVEEGFVLPGTFVVGSDSHSNLYGAIGALGTPVVRTDAAAIWATGRTWWQVPDVVRVRLDGQLRPGVVGKDVIVALCGVFNNDEVLNCCIEFSGPGVASLSIEERMTISNMTTEWGALAGVFLYDEITRNYLLARAEHFEQRGDPEPRLTTKTIAELDPETLQADPDAHYAKELDFDLSAVTPFVSGPNTVKTITPLAELEQQGVRIDKAYLMSCVNARLQDFEAAAAVMRGKRVAEHVDFYIAAASDEVERQARDRGFWQTLVEAGATELPPGCGACIGLGTGTLEAGEVGISATNRNFKGRMGSREAFVYLSSPAVVAASAVAGSIAAPEQTAMTPRDLREQLSAGSACRVNPREETTTDQVVILPDFPRRIEGELLFVPQDNLNTDGIYGKDYTYKDGMTPEQMAAVAMENYDPEFQRVAREGDILVGGYNFGSGSSREQAATALKFRGLQMIIAGSYSQTYKRNAFNNGYVVIECPKLVDELKAAHGDSTALTIRTGHLARIDFVRAQIEYAGKQYSFAPLGDVAQELIVKGGFEAVIRDQIAGAD